MDVMDGDGRSPAPVPRLMAQSLYVIPTRGSDVRISVVVKSPAETVHPLDSSNPPSTTSSSEIDFERDRVAGKNSKATTPELSGVDRDPPGWTGSTTSLMKCSRNSLSRLPEEGGMEFSLSDSDSNPFESSNPSLTSTSSSSEASFGRDHVKRNNLKAAIDGPIKVTRSDPNSRLSKIIVLRGSRKLLAKLRGDGGILKSSSFEDDAIASESSKRPLATYASQADFDPDHVLRDNSEAATAISSRFISDAPGSFGFSLMRRSRKLLAKLRTDRGMDPPNSQIIMNEEARRQESASKLEGSFTSADEGGQKRNSPRTAFPDDESPHARSRLRVQAQSGGDKEGLNRALKGIVSIQKSVTKLAKTRPDEYRRKVVVNGVPIKDEYVKKAEESAGPIHPGNYWYDVHAGFWGAEPGPCLGIIPPCILELNTSMSKACAGGNTGILVNGRELHGKDLERLAFRGLPTTPGKAYLISIEGRVVDESSKKHITCLGMLAPSLEKSGRGTGMYIPFVTTSSQSSPISQ